MLGHTFACLLALAASINAQAFGLPDLTQLPTCAIKSATSGLQATGCELRDLTCICKSDAFLRALGTQLSSICSPDEQKKTVDFGNTICEPLGIKIPYDNLPGADDTSSSSSAAAPSATASSEPAEASTCSAPIAGETSPPYPVANGTNGTTGTNGSYVPFTGASATLNVGFSGLIVGALAAVGMILL